MRRRILAAIMTLALLCTCLPVRAEDSYEARIFQFLTETMGLNKAAACGVLGNLHVETGGTFSPAAYNPNDSGGTQSFGICQWNNGGGAGDRYGMLYAWCRANDLDPEDLEGQLRFMQYELETMPYLGLDSLRKVPDTAAGAFEASQIWAIYFEGCSSAGYAQRGSYAVRTYWPKYSAQKPAEAQETVYRSSCGGDQSLCASAGFTDAPAYGNWAHSGIDYVLACGYFNGTSKTTFSPEGTMTRAMLVTVLWRGCGSPVGYENPFSDVSGGVYYAQAAAWGHTFGVVKGMGEGVFAPDETVTREQIAVFLFRLTQLGESDSGKRADLSMFPDQDEVSTFARKAMQWAVASELIAGVGSDGKAYLQPKAGATRAQVATIIMRFAKMLEEVNQGTA